MEFATNFTTRKLSPESGIKPHVMAQYTSPDELVECFAVSDALYDKVWNRVVEYMTECPSEVPDMPEHNSIAGFWHLFTDAERNEINDVLQRAYYE